MYILVVGRVPFRNEIQTALGRLQFPPDVVISDCENCDRESCAILISPALACQNLIRRCLCVTPTRRITLAEIRAHDWCANATLNYVGSFRSILRVRSLARGNWQSASARSHNSRALRRRDSALTLSSEAEASDEEPQLCLRARYADGGDGALIVPPAAIAAAATAAARERKASAAARSTPPPPPQTTIMTEAATASRASTPSSQRMRAENVGSRVNEESRAPRITSSPLPARRRHPRLRDIAHSRQPSVTTSFDVFRSVASSTASTYYESLTSSVTTRNRRGADWRAAALDDATSLSQGSTCFYSARQSFDYEPSDAQNMGCGGGAPLASGELYHSTISTNVDRSLAAPNDGLGVGYEESLRSLVLSHIATLDEDAKSEARYLPSGGELHDKLPCSSRVASSSSSSSSSLSSSRASNSNERGGGEVRRWFSDIRRARSLKLSLRSKQQRSASKTASGELTAASSDSLPIVRRLAAQSYGTLAALGSAMVEQSEGLARLREQLNATSAQIHPSSASTVAAANVEAAPPPKPTTTSDNCASTSAKRRSLIDNAALALSENAPTPLERRHDRRRRPLSTIAATCSSDSKHASIGSLQYDSQLRFPLAIFCAQQYPL